MMGEKDRQWEWKRETKGKEPEEAKRKRGIKRKEWIKTGYVSHIVKMQYWQPGYLARLRESHDVSLASVFYQSWIHSVAWNFASSGVSCRGWLWIVTFYSTLSDTATFGLHLFNNVEWADLDFELLKRDHAGPATARLSYTPCVDLTSRCLGRYARLFLAIACGDPGNNASTSNVNTVVGFPRRRPLTGAQRQLVALARFDAVQRQLTNQN